MLPWTRHDVFLSYSRTDRELAKHFAQALHAAGVKVWMDTSHIPAARVFAVEIVRALSRCRVVVFLNTEASRTSEWCSRELEIALAHGKPVIPVLADGASIAEPVKHLQGLTLRLEDVTVIPGVRGLRRVFLLVALALMCLALAMAAGARAAHRPLAIREDALAGLQELSIEARTLERKARDLLAARELYVKEAPGDTQAQREVRFEAQRKEYASALARLKAKLQTRTRTHTAVDACTARTAEAAKDLYLAPGVVPGSRGPGFAEQWSKATEHLRQRTDAFALQQHVCERQVMELLGALSLDDCP